VAPDSENGFSMRRPSFTLAWAVASAAALSAGAAALLSVHEYRTRAAWTLEMDGPLPALARGFYPAEQGPDGLTFAWTEPAADISLEGLDRRVEWTLSLVVMVWRPAGTPHPDIHLMVDGVERLAVSVSRDFEQIDLVLPERPARRGAVVSLRVVPPFAPGSGADTRQLGVAVDRIALAPSGASVLPPPRTLVGLTVAAALLGAAFALSGVPALVAAAAALPLAAAGAWLGSRALTPYLGYAHQVLLLAFWVGVSLVLTVRGLEWMRGRRLDAAGRFVAIASAAAMYLRMLVLLHPGMPVGDALFHAHRLEYVLAGRAFFTSVAPGDYTFPYPILLYTVAAPWSVLTETSAEHIVLLRSVVTAAIVLASVLVYFMVARAWNDRLAGAVAMVTCHLLPLEALTMVWGNLTNAFGQPLFVATTALLASRRLRAESWRRVWALAGVMTAAFLAHPSTFGILSGLVGFTWILYALGRRADATLGSAARAVFIAGAVAGGLAVVLYYAHFLGTYQSTFARIGSEIANAGTGPELNRVSAGLTAVPTRLVAYYGWPALLLAIYGAVALRSVAPHDRLRLVLAAWAGSCLAFLVLGLLTPIELRYYLAAIPVVAMLVGLAWSRVWHRHPRWRIALVALTGWMVWVGAAAWVARLA